MLWYVSTRLRWTLTIGTNKVYFTYMMLALMLELCLSRRGTNSIQKIANRNSRLSRTYLLLPYPWEHLAIYIPFLSSSLCLLAARSHCKVPSLYEPGLVTWTLLSFLIGNTYKWGTCNASVMTDMICLWHSPIPLWFLKSYVSLYGFQILAPIFLHYANVRELW